VIIRTDKCVRPRPGYEAADEGFIIQHTDVNQSGWLRFDTRIHKSFTHTGDTRMDGLSLLD
jgi:hypothetical protein